MTSSSSEPGMSFNNKLDKASSPSHQHMEEKKSSRKRRMSTNSSRSAKRRRISRRPTKNGETLGDSSIVEPQPLPNGVSMMVGPHSELKDFKPSEQGDNLNIDRPRRCEAQSKAYAYSNGNQKITPSIQVTLLDEADFQSSPSLAQGDKVMKSVQPLASERAQNQTERMVLRARTQSITGMNPPLAKPKELIGRRIKVYWPRDSAYYCGVVRVYDPKRRKHKVVYDDGDVEWLCLQRENYTLESISRSKTGETGDLSHTGEDQNDQKLGVSTRKRVVGKTFSDIKAAVAAVKTQKYSELSARKRKYQEGPAANHISKGGILLDGAVKYKKASVYVRKRKKPRGRPRVAKDMETFSNTPSSAVAVVGRQLKRSARRQVQKLAEADSRSTMSQVSIVEFISAEPAGNKAGPAGVNGRPIRKVKKTYKLESLTQTHEAGAALCGHGDGHKEAVLTNLVMPMPSRLHNKAMLSPHHEESQPMNSSDCSSGVEISRKKSITDKMELRGAGRKLFPRNPVPRKKSVGALRRRSKRRQKRKKRPPPLQDFPSPNKRRRINFKKAEMKQRRGASFFSGHLLSEPWSSGVQDFAKKYRTAESCSHNPLEAFNFTIHLPRPAVVPGLLIWPLFNMLRTTGLSGGERFEGRFSWRGSTRDFANIALLLMSVIKSHPFDCQRHSQDWQGKMLHDFWAVLSRKNQWTRNLPAVLSPRGEDLLMKHMRQLMKQVDGNESLTFKQVLSLFVCYIIKPFLIAVLCERGAQPTLVVQRFLVSICSVRRVLSFKRLSVKWVKMRPCGRAEADFLSYLSHFPSCRRWSMANGILHKLVTEQGDGSMADKGSSKLLVLGPSFNFSSNQGLQFSTSVIKFKPMGGNHTSGLQKKNSGHDGSVTTSFMGRLAFIEDAGDFRSILHSQSSSDLYTGLCLASMMQKHLLTVDGWCGTHKSSERSIPCPAEEYHRLKCSLHHREGMTDGDDGRLHVGREWSDVVDGTRLDYQSLSFVANGIMMGSRVEAFSSSKQTVGADWEANDSMLSALGSSSNSSLECAPRWKSTSMAEVGFKSINNMGDQHGTSPRHGGHEDTSHLSCAHGFKKQSGTKRRPHPRRMVEEDTMEANGRELNPCCIANVLITDKDRSWREVAVKVELQSNGNDWVIWVHREGAPCSHKVVDSAVTSRVNRHTHAIMWKGCDGWMLEFSDRKQWMRFKRIYEECSHRNARAAFMRQIPIPSWRLVERRVESPPWSRVTPGMIKEEQGEVEVALTRTHEGYDVDSEDERWLEEMNGRADCIEEPISIETFEHIVDKLERITYLRQGHMVAARELVDLCQNSGRERVVLAVHAHWSKKRAAKNNFLIRCFQVPLWKKYQEQHECWESQVNELRKQWPMSTLEELYQWCPKPPMFSYCMQSRNVDMTDMSKRMQKQRSQKHLHPSSKHLRVLGTELAERFSLLRSQKTTSSPEASLHGTGSESAQFEYPSGYGEMSFWARKKVEKVLWEQLTSSLSPHRVASDHHRRAEEAQAKATTARKIAAARAAKAQAQFLRFSMALQRAGAALMEFKRRYSAEAALLSIEWREASQKLLGKGANHLFKKSDLMRGDDTSIEDDSDNDDGDCGGGHEQGPDDGHEDDNGQDDDDGYSWNDSEEDGFRGPSSDNLQREEAYSLSVSERANLAALMRSTLRQRTR